MAKLREHDGDVLNRDDQPLPTEQTRDAQQEQPADQHRDEQQEQQHELADANPGHGVGEAAAAAADAEEEDITHGLGVDDEEAIHRKLAQREKSQDLSQEEILRLQQGFEVSMRALRDQLQAARAGAKDLELARDDLLERLDQSRIYREALEATVDDLTKTLEDQRAELEKQKEEIRALRVVSDKDRESPHPGLPEQDPALDSVLEKRLKIEKIENEAKEAKEAKEAEDARRTAELLTRSRKRKGADQAVNALDHDGDGKREDYELPERTDDVPAKEEVIKTNYRLFSPIFQAISAALVVGITYMQEKETQAKQGQSTFQPLFTMAVAALQMLAFVGVYRAIKKQANTRDTGGEVVDNVPAWQQVTGVEAVGKGQDQSLLALANPINPALKVAAWGLRVKESQAQGTDHSKLM